MTKDSPKNPISITTYSKLEEYARSFAKGSFGFVLVIGPPGIGKSRVFRHALGVSTGWIEGNASAIGIYRRAYENRDEPIVLCDVDGLHRDREAVRLLKSLCETERPKRVAWQKETAMLQRENIPREFTTTSSVAIIANDWKTMNKDIAALQDRGHVFQFEPSAIEIHCRAAQFFTDQEVFDFIAQYLHLIEDHSLRTYTKALELKQAGFDWRADVRCWCMDEKVLIAAKLKEDESFKTDKDRVRAFKDMSGGSKATYYRYLEKLKPTTKVPEIKLTNATRPPEDLYDVLHKRYGRLGRG